MNPPIFVDERGDISIYGSVAEAEADLEVMAVEHGRYIVTDADGRLLTVGVVIEEIPYLWGICKKRTKKIRISDR